MLTKKRAFIALIVVLESLIFSACGGETKTAVVTQSVTENEPIVETAIKKETSETDGEVVVKEEVEVSAEAAVTARPEPVTVSKGGELTESSLAGVESFNPILSVDSASHDVNSLLYNALVDLSPEDGSVVPDLAESWEVSADSLTFTYYLREDVKWHDGEPFTAEDVKFTYDMILNRAVNSPRRADFADILTPEQIVVLDDYTIQFQLSHVDATWMFCKDMLGIIPQHILGDLSPEEFNNAQFNTLAPLGTGPFMFREWVKDDYVALVKNPEYFKAEPNLDAIYFKVVENQTEEFAQLQTGEVDHAEVMTAMWEEAVKQEHLTCKAYPNFSFTFYIYQLDAEKTPLFLDARTRRALLLGLDRQAMVDGILFGLGDVAHSTVPPISWAHNPDNQPQYGFDQVQARALLENAGWIDADGDGVREAHGVEGVEDGTPFSFEIHTNVGNQEREQVVVTMQQYWAEIGVDARPIPIEWNTLLAELTETHEYDIVVVGFGWDIDPNQRTMWHTDSYGGGFNMNKYSNPELDGILDAALLTADQAERREFYFEMQHILAEDVPAPILYFRRALYCWNKRLHEFDPNAINIRGNAHEWWVDK